MHTKTPLSKLSTPSIETAVHPSIHQSTYAPNPHPPITNPPPSKILNLSDASHEIHPLHQS